MPFDLYRAYRWLRGRPARVVHVMFSTRTGLPVCADYGEPWDKDHVCDVVAVNR